MNLAGIFNNKNPLFNVDMQIEFDDKGNFKKVRQGNKTYSVTEWNAKIEREFNK